MERRHKKRVGDAFLDKCNRYVHLSTEDHLFVPELSEFRVYAHDLQEVLDHADVDHVIVNVPGFKCYALKYFEFIDKDLYRNISPNTYDIGFVYKFEGVPYVDRSIRYNEKFCGRDSPVFSSVHDAVIFNGKINEIGISVKIYNYVADIMTALWGRQLDIPVTYMQICDFQKQLELFRVRVNQDPDIFLTHIRFDVTVKHSSFLEG